MYSVKGLLSRRSLGGVGGGGGWLDGCHDVAPRASLLETVLGACRCRATPLSVSGGGYFIVPVFVVKSWRSFPRFERRDACTCSRGLGCFRANRRSPSRRACSTRTERCDVATRLDRSLRQSLWDHRAGRVMYHQRIQRPFSVHNSCSLNPLPLSAMRLNDRHARPGIGGGVWPFGCCGRVRDDHATMRRQHHTSMLSARSRAG